MMLRAGAARKKYRSYTQQALEEAILKIQNGQSSVRNASRTYNIPKTLLDKMKGRCPLKAKSDPNPTLSEEEEEKLVKWICDMNKIG
ncbi:hypothetical protein HOLleu_01844 [Holothuria leucospilota]|uniref:HTH psq-type domain-containing protein n=1 Tax=Holothuria leucospilota TaxID=206669 RepID=A0A9Q1HGP1_HOLLE|nr:hypothetical protein HOLleu_01844 [Holothuria leucospilota]